MNYHRTLVTFTIDTEPDNQWEDYRSTDIENITYLPRLQALFHEFGVKPTYLITYSMAANPIAVDQLSAFLVSDAHLEIGAHLHPWDNPPFADDVSDVTYQVFPHDLPLELFQAKLKALTDIIRHNFPSPVSYRAGRFGITGAHVRVLEELGYRVDTSVTPLIDRGDKFALPSELGGKGGRDFRRAPLAPYHPSYEDIRRIGTAKLIEIPLTVNFTRRVPTAFVSPYQSMPTIIMRGLRKTGIIRPVCAQPTQFGLPDILRMLRVCLAEEMPILNFTFHSSEVMPGGSPRFRTSDSIEALYTKLRDLLVWLSAASVSFATLKQAADTLLRAGLIRHSPPDQI